MRFFSFACFREYYIIQDSKIWSNHATKVDKRIDLKFLVKIAAAANASFK